MAITLNDYAFGESVCSVQESLKEAGGRDARKVVLKGVLEGLPSIAAIEAELDAIASAGGDVTPVPLSLRPGRVLMVKRIGFARQVYRDALTASFELTLEAPLALEEAEEESLVTGLFDKDNPIITIACGGNTLARPIITLTPAAECVRPSIGIGAAVLTFDGVVGAGEALVVDAAAGVVMLEGEDVTPYTEGTLPLLAPGDNELEYTDESDSPTAVSVSVRFRARWW